MNDPVNDPARPGDDVQQPARPRRFAGGINRYPPYRSKVEDMLRYEHRETYEDMLTRNVPLKRLHAWLLERGYDVGSEAVRRHREKFLGDFAHVRRGAEAAEQFGRVARAAGLSLSDAAVGGMHQTLMEFFSRDPKAAAALTAKDVQALAVAADQFVDTHQRVEQARRELAKAAVGSAPADPAAVVDRMRQILGLPAAGKQDGTKARRHGGTAEADAGAGPPDTP